MKFWGKVFISCTVLNFTLFAAPDYSTKANGTAVPTLHPANTLNTSIGVRSFGMGEAMTGRADDLSSMYYNPAGLSTMEYWEWGLSHQEMANDVDGNGVNLAAPLPYGTLGVQMSLFTVRDNDQITDRKEDHPDNGKFAYLAGLSYGAPVWRKFLHAGITFKWIGADFSTSPAGATSNFEDQSKGLFIDIGLLGTYDLANLKGFFYYFPKVAMGFAARNLHPKFRLDNEFNDNAEEFNLGLSFYYSYKFQFNVDFVNSIDNHSRFHFGTEIWPDFIIAEILGRPFPPIVALRGGIATEGPDRGYVGYYWGAGLGHAFGISKLSVEYSGLAESFTGRTGSYQFLHQIAVHQSFEKIAKVKDPYGNERKLRLAQTDRYNTPLQFAAEQKPDEIVDYAVLLALTDKDKDKELIQEQNNEEYIEQTTDTETTTTTTTTTTDQQVDIKPPKKIKRATVGLFPFSVEFVGKEGNSSPLSAQIRKPIIKAIIRDKYLKSLSELRYKNTPRKEARENQIEYLNRLCQFHRAKMVAFGRLTIDEGNDKLTLKIIYYKKGDKQLTSEAIYEGSEAGLEELTKEIKEDFILQAIGILNLQA